MDYKVCSKCGKTLPATTKYFHRSGKNGLRSACKGCYKIYSSSHYDKNKGSIKAHSKEYYKRNTEHIKEKHKQYMKDNVDKIQKQYKHWYETNSEYKKKYHRKHYDSEQAKIYYKNNVEQIKKQSKKYRQSRNGKIVGVIKNQKSRAKRLNVGGFYTKEQWSECLKFFDNKCAYTGEILTCTNINVEHIIPMSKGGSNYICNIVPALNYVNKSKANKDFESWYKQQPYFSIERLEKIKEWIKISKNNLNLKEND